MATKDQALAVAQAIVAAMPNREILHRMWLYGSVAYRGVGADIDIVFEVNQAAFQNYQRMCRVVLDGVNFMTNNLLIWPYGTEWEYFSPKPDRCQAALNELGIDPEQLVLPVAMDELDLICLPAGWDDTASAVHQELMQHAEQSRDPHFISHVIGQREPLYPTSTA